MEGVTHVKLKINIFWMFLIENPFRRLDVNENIAF